MKNPSDANKPPPAGARSDDSSLFSLEALKVNKAAATEQLRSTKEDSGLIDLRALAAIERGGDKKNDLDVAAVVAPENIFGGGLGMPLIAPPPASAVAAPPPDYRSPAAGNNRNIVIAGSAVAIAAIIGAVFVFTRGSTAAPTTPTATAVAASAKPSAAPAEPTANEPQVAAVTPGQRPTAPTATASAAATEKPVAKAPVVKGPMPKAVVTATAAAAAPPPPPKEACDLTCQMQRAVQKK